MRWLQGNILLFGIGKFIKKNVKNYGKKNQLKKENKNEKEQRKQRKPKLIVDGPRNGISLKLKF